MPLADAMLRFKKHDHFFGKPDGQNGTEDGAEFSDLETIVRFIPNSNISNKANLQSSESFSNKGIAEGITTVGGWQSSSIEIIPSQWEHHLALQIANNRSAMTI